MATRKLIKAATVLSMDARIGNQTNMDILLEDDKILEVDKNVGDATAEVIMATDMIAMPGFVDAHHHMWMGLLRNQGTPFATRQLFAGPQQAALAATLSPDDVYLSSYSSALNAIDSGITSVFDHANLATAAQLEANTRALAAAGLRVLQAAPAHLGAAGLQALRDSLPSTRIQLALASSAPQDASLEQIQAEWELARSLGLRISAQAGMGAAARPDGLAALAKAKLLGPDVLLAHGNTLSERDLAAIKEARAAVVITPAAEMMLGYGAPTVQRFLDAGFTPGLGIDSEIASRGDMFTQMRTVNSMQHAMRFEKKLAGNLFTDRMLTTRDVIQFVSSYGAHALGMQEHIGSLAPGKQADILLLRQNHINVMPVNDPIGAVAWAMDNSNIDSVLVAGEFLKRAGQLLHVELDALQPQIAQAAQRMTSAVPA